MPKHKAKTGVQRYVRKINLPASPLLDHLCHAAGLLYSQVLTTYWRILRKTGNGKQGRKVVFLSQYGMEKLHPKDPLGALHAHSCDAVVGNFYASLKSANERKKKGQASAKYPRRRRRFFKVTWKSAGIRVKDGHLVLSTGKGLDEVRLPWTHALPTMVEIGWKQTGGYELRAVYEVERVGAPLGQGVAGVDLGELRAATVYDGEQVTLYSGRLVRSKNRYRAKTLAKLDALIARTRKGTAAQPSSRRRKKLLRAKRRVRVKVSNQIRDVLQKQTTHLVSTLHQQGVQTVAIGDLRDIRGRIDYGKKANQQLHGWAAGVFRQYVEYKARRHGMQAVLVDEAYTSQSCPRCGQRHKPKKRTYACGCGFTADRDGVGAMNIRAKYQGTFGNPVVGVMSPPTRGVRYDAHFPRHLRLNTARTLAL